MNAMWFCGAGLLLCLLPVLWLIQRAPLGHEGPNGFEYGNGPDLPAPYAQNGVEERWGRGGR